jgi:mono/diheme cytochrome c family protein
MDFFIQPLPFDDQVHTVSKISALWGLPTDEELASHQLPSAMLGWTGGTASVAHFLTGFVDLGGGQVSAWPDEKLAPLADYVASLRAPPSSTTADVTRGREVYIAECQSCHGGPRGMGDRVYGFDEIGTDDAIKWWADGPDHDGQPCCGLRFPPGDVITHGIKSPRLVGLSSMRRFLHNGALDSLEQLLCLAPRPKVSEPAFGGQGHEFGCELPSSDRTALLDYLRAH